MIFWLFIKYPLNFLLIELASHVPNLFVPALHRLRGVKIGRDVSISRQVYLDNLHPELIEIEDGARITAHCVVVGHFSPSRKIIDGPYTISSKNFEMDT